MSVPELPQVLKSADWSKQKGIVAKVLKKDTGVGAALKKVEAAHASFAPLPDEPKDLTAAGKLVDAVEGNMPKYTLLRKALSELGPVLVLTAKVFKESSLIPSSSRKHVEKMQAELKRFDGEVKTALNADAGLIKGPKAKLAAADKFFGGSFDLDKVLADGSVGAAFAAFLKSEHSTENLAFYQATASRPRGPAARKVYEQFVSDSAPDMINLPAAMKKYFDELENTGAWGNPDWSAARQEIKALIKNDSSGRFKTSPMFYKAL